MTLDLIIHGGYVITMEGPGTGIINRGAVGIKGNKIVAVGEEQDVMSRYTAHRYICLLYTSPQACGNAQTADSCYQFTQYCAGAQ